MYKQVDLLNQSELEVLDTIDTVVTRRYRKYGVHTKLGKNKSKSEQFMEKVSVMDRNLKRIMERMSEQDHSKERFLESYAEWRKNREKCIDELKKIAKSLDRDRFVANTAKLCGLCLSVGGGIGLIASGGITAGPSSVLMIGGGLTATGTTIVLGTSITESVRLIRKIKKARRLIEKDQVYFQDIQEGLNHARELQEALISVLDIDILRSIRTYIKEIIRGATKIKDEFKRLRFIEKKVDSIFGENTDIPRMMPKIIIKVILLLCKTENRLVFDFASVTFKSATVVGLLVGKSLEAVISTSSKIGLSSAQVLKLATGLVGITLDAVAIVRTCVDIHRNSRSPEARKITTAATNYSKEVEMLDALYEGLLIDLK